MPPEQESPPAVDVNKDIWYMQRWIKWSGIAVAVLALFAVVALFVINMIWNASPEKALLDAADYALNKPGTYHVQSGKNADMKVQAKGGAYKITGTLSNMPVTIIIKDATLYAKSSNPKQLYDAFLKSSSKSKTTAALLSGILPSLKNRWISIGLDNQTIQSTFFGNIHCFLGTQSILTRDEDSRKKLSSVYAANPFLEIKESRQFNYSVKIDSEKLSDFQQGLSDTKASESLVNCAKSIQDLSSDVSSGAATISLSEVDHSLRTMTFGESSETETRVTASYGKVDKITAPTDAIDISQVVNSILETFLGKGV